MNMLGLATLAGGLIVVPPAGQPAWGASDCLDGQAVGLFTLRQDKEAGRSRSQPGDGTLENLLGRSLRSSGARLVPVAADSRDEAVSQARAGGLTLLAALEVEAQSRAIDLDYGATDLVDVAADLTLKLIMPASGEVVGEANARSKAPGLDIEDALPELVQKPLQRLVKQAASGACDRGLPEAPLLVADASETSEQSELIRLLQRELNARGYDAGEDDGRLGERSQSAIRAAERDANLTPTGEPSEQLLDWVRAQPIEDRLLFQAEELLVELGLLESAPAGVRTTPSELAIRDAERAFGLPRVDGVADEQLLGKLRAEVRRRKAAAAS